MSVAGKRRLMYVNLTQAAAALHASAGPVMAAGLSDAGPVRAR
jgi:hypothetical protein